MSHSSLHFRLLANCSGKLPQSYCAIWYILPFILRSTFVEAMVFWALANWAWFFHPFILFLMNILSSITLNDRLTYTCKEQSDFKHMCISPRAIVRTVTGEANSIADILSSFMSLANQGVGYRPQSIMMNRNKTIMQPYSHFPRNALKQDGKLALKSPGSGLNRLAFNSSNKITKRKNICRKNVFVKCWNNRKYNCPKWDSNSYPPADSHLF